MPGRYHKSKVSSVFPSRFSKSNHPAIIGFLVPFAAAGIASITILWGWNDYSFFYFGLTFAAIIPLLLLFGLWLSIKSIPLIQEKGDKDYAYSGLVLNLFFILLYIFSAICMTYIQRS
jgi:hypothetical protein